MSPTPARRAGSSYACVAAFVSVASPLHADLPVTMTQPAGAVPVERPIGVPGNTSLQGYRRHLRATVSGLSITARVTASSGGRDAQMAHGCAATVVLVVTVAFGRRRAWSRDTVLIYQPPRGVHVLNSRTSTKDRAHRDAASVRFPLPRPRHGRTLLTLKLSLRAGPSWIRDRHGRRHREIGARVGGTLRITKGPHTLGHAVLRLLVPIRCATSKPGGHGKKRFTTH